MSHARAAAVATHDVAAEHATGVLRAGGSAVKAALTGFFAAAGHEPGVLFGPMSLLVGGIGEGARAFDGRAFQPGLEGRRPRGFVGDGKIPLAARVAIPGSLWAAVTCLGYHSGVSLAACVKPAVRVAREQGDKGRADFLSLLARLGPAVFLDAQVRHAWLTQYGPVEGGLVTLTDLQPRTGLDHLAVRAGDVLLPPWRSASSTEQREDNSIGHALVAIDGQGLFAAMTFNSLASAATLGTFGLCVPLLAVPVTRGVPRVTPGAALGGSGAVGFVLGGHGLVRAEADAGAAGAVALYRNAESREVTAVSSTAFVG